MGLCQAESGARSVPRQEPRSESTAALSISPGTSLPGQLPDRRERPSWRLARARPLQPEGRGGRSPGTRRAGAPARPVPGPSDSGRRPPDERAAEPPWRVLAGRRSKPPAPRRLHRRQRRARSGDARLARRAPRAPCEADESAHAIASMASVGTSRPAAASRPAANPPGVNC